jgi:hypothetical protein
MVVSRGMSTDTTASSELSRRDSPNMPAAQVTALPTSKAPINSVKSRLSFRTIA